VTKRTAWNEYSAQPVMEMQALKKPGNDLQRQSQAIRQANKTRSGAARLRHIAPLHPIWVGGRGCNRASWSQPHN